MCNIESETCKCISNIIINKEIFNKEISICKELSKKNNGRCNWGKCESCGVIPLLYKLYKGELLEDNEQIKKIKQKTFDNN